MFMSLHHHEEDLALKSPVNTDKDGLRLFMSLKRFPKLDIKQLKLSTILTWEQQITDNHLFLLKLISNSSASLK